MEFLEDTNRENLNCTHGAGAYLYGEFQESNSLSSRLIFKKATRSEQQSEDAETWGNPDIDALLDNRALRLLTKQEVMDELNAIREHLRERLAVIRSSRGNVSDFIMQITAGGEIQQKLDFVLGNLDELRTKMYEEETAHAYDMYKDQFDAAIADIIGTKAEIQKETLEKFIDKADPYLDRVAERARKEGLTEVSSMVSEAREITRNKSQEDIENTLAWLAGDEHDMSPTEYRAWSEKLEGDATSVLERRLEGKIDAQDLDTRYSDLLDDAREKGGEKAVLRLRMLKHKYQIRRESYELAELAYVREIFGEDDGEGKLHQEIRNVQAQIRSGEKTESEAAAELFARLTMLTESASAKLAFHVRDGELAHTQEFLGELSRQYDDAPNFASILSECDSFRSSLTAREARHRSTKERYEGHMADSKEDLNRVSHDALVYHYAYKDLTEKETARALLSNMSADMSDAMELMQSDWATGDLATMQATAYTLTRLDDFFETTAAIDLPGSPPHRTRQSRQAPSIDYLLAGFSAFEGHETSHGQVIEELSAFDTELAGKIQERIHQVDGEVRFVSRESFDRFFDGKRRDNFKGLPGAFHNGTIFLVYPLDTLNSASVEKLYEVLTHEAIHHTMHDEVEGETADFLNVLLYKSPTFSQAGLELALSGNTLGAHIIRQFMIDRGDEFEDWVQKRTKIGATRKPNGKLTFEEVIKNADVAKEILEEAITVYLTYYALNGRQLQMSPPYLDYLRQFHETDEGQDTFAKFLPHSDDDYSTYSEDVSLGADTGAGASGISAASGGEETAPVGVPDLDELTARVATLHSNPVQMIENLLKELYNVEDYEGILETARQKLGSVTQALDELKEREKEGEEISEATRQALKTELDTLEKTLNDNMLKKLQKEKEKREEKPGDDWGYARRMWENTTFVAIDDFLKIFQDAWAYLKERRELRRDRVSSEIGASAAPTERMSSYFEGLNQSVQNRDVSKWKEIYTDKDPETLNEVLDKARDENQVKALFEMKAEAYGDFFFRNRQTMDALERISGRKIDTYYQAKAVFDEIYGRGEAEGLERKNSSSRQGKVNEASEMAKSHADSLGLEWMKMIGDMQQGNWVDSAKFEGFVNYAITAGKSYQRHLLWVIAKGFELGILDHKVLVEMGGSGLIANNPIIEYMGKLAKDHDSGIIYKGGMSELLYIASLDLFTPGGKQTNQVEGATADQLNDWVNYERWLRKAGTDESVQQRYGKLKSSMENVDHDYIQDMWWDFNISAYDSIFTERSGSVQFVQDEGIANIYAQFVTDSLQWSDKELAERYRKWFKTDKILIEDNYQNNGSAFDKKGGVKQRVNNKTVLDAGKLEKTGALYYGMPMKYFRNLTYFAYKQAGGDMQVARDIMMAGSLDLGNDWVPEAMIGTVYAANGWDISGFERWKGNVNVKGLPDAPMSHLIDDGGSMAGELGGTYPG